MFGIRAPDAFEGGSSVLHLVLEQCRFRHAERLVERGIELRRGVRVVRVGVYRGDVEFDRVATRRIEDLSRIPCKASFLEQFVNIDRKLFAATAGNRRVFSDGGGR